MRQRVLAFKIQTEREKANKRLNSPNQRMLRAEKINIRIIAWLWKETNIWSRAACQLFGYKKSGKKQYVLTSDPKPLQAFPQFLSLLLLNILLCINPHSQFKKTQWNEIISQDDVIRLVTSVWHITVTCCVDTQLNLDCKRKVEDAAKQSHQTLHA